MSWILSLRRRTRSFLKNIRRSRDEMIVSKLSSISSESNSSNVKRAATDAMAPKAVATTNGLVTKNWTTHQAMKKLPKNAEMVVSALSKRTFQKNNMSNNKWIGAIIHMLTPCKASSTISRKAWTVLTKSETRLNSLRKWIRCRIVERSSKE